MNPYKRGMLVAVLLAVMTIAEYIFAVEVHESTVRFLGLTATAGVKVYLIAQFFMHFSNIFKPSSEAH
ncbi:MAG: hypothetical protein R3B97_13810 [Dehalococcoidia bacterium]|nr:hypothetical protein [Dehalococcoidia bacterium]